MTTDDWILIVAALTGCGPVLGWMAYVTWCAVRAHGKEEV